MLLVCVCVHVCVCMYVHMHAFVVATKSLCSLHSCLPFHQGPCLSHHTTQACYLTAHLQLLYKSVQKSEWEITIMDTGLILFVGCLCVYIARLSVRIVMSPWQASGLKCCMCAVSGLQ